LLFIDVLEIGDIRGLSFQNFALLTLILHGNVQVMEALEKPGEASLQPKSPEQAPMDVTEDEHDKALLKFNEDELRVL
jgi:hypothetical protein